MGLLSFFSSRPPKVTRVAAPPGTVRRITTTLLEQRGWQKRWGAWTGPYATRFGTWPGKIEQAGGGALRVFIHKPPACLQSHSRWPCFHRHGRNGWWSVNLHHQPTDGDPNAVIRYIEQIISEAFRNPGVAAPLDDIEDDDEPNDI
jgi:hypothetical protein